MTDVSEMTALRAHRRGGPEVLVVERAPVPALAAGEVLIEVRAAAITFDELTWEETWARVDRTPVIPSHEVSGVVAAVGAGVSDVAVGDEVYGLIRFDRDGAAAQYVAVPAVDVASRPTTVSHVVSAALPLAGLTAWQALVEHADVRAGARVLVLGGAGGVGALTVELAVWLGADVTATVRGDDARALVEGLGATRVIDTRREGFDDGRYDVVIDTVGGAVLEEAFAGVRAGGRLVTLSAPPPGELAEAHDVDATFFIVEPNRSQLIRLADLVDGGRLHVAIAGTYPLTRGREAFEHGRRSHRPGKTVLTID